MANRHGQSIEDYLKTIYLLGEEHPQVTASMLSETLQVSAAAVTKMGRRLQAKNLVEYDRSRGFTLIDQGRAIALEMVRHHRLLEKYLHEELGYPWDRVHEEAEVLEHVISEEFEERIDRLLGHPTHDPHGDPIPTREGLIDERQFPSLNKMEIGETAIIRRVTNQDSTMLEYMGRLGLYPDTELRLIAREPYGGSLQFCLGDEEISVGYILAEHVFVEINKRNQTRTKKERK